MPKMEAVVEEASMYEQSAMGASILSPNSSSINTLPGSIVLKMSKSKIFKFGEDINVDSDEYESDEEGLEAEYKPSWADAPDLEYSGRNPVNITLLS
jgi:hypothetical protein